MTPSLSAVVVARLRNPFACATGAPVDPDWYRNLVADHEAKVDRQIPVVILTEVKDTSSIA